MIEWRLLVHPDGITSKKPDGPGSGSDRRSATAVESAFTTRIQLALRQRPLPRFLGALAVAAALLAILIFLGPDRDDVKRRFEVYGAEGEIRLMPEISIDKGADAVHQLPQSYQEPPPPSVEIVPDDTYPNAEKEVPKVLARDVDSKDQVADATVPEAEIAAEEQVELTLPQQTSRDFIIKRLVRPQYPVDASRAERAVPVIRVDAAIFVSVTGDVQAAMVTYCEGGKAFEEEVLRAVRQWLFEWRMSPPPEVGRWLEMSWRFKSPLKAEDARPTGSAARPRAGERDGGL